MSKLSDYTYIFFKLNMYNILYFFKGFLFLNNISIVSSSLCIVNKMFKNEINYLDVEQLWEEYNKKFNYTKKYSFQLTLMLIIFVLLTYAISYTKNFFTLPLIFLFMYLMCVTVLYIIIYAFLITEQDNSKNKAIALFILLKNPITLIILIGLTAINFDFITKNLIYGVTLSFSIQIFITWLLFKNKIENL